MKTKITINGKPYDATKYPMPQYGQDNPVPITVDGKKDEARITRGGDPPMTYSYFYINGESYYVKGHLSHNAQVKTYRS